MFFCGGSEFWCMLLCCQCACHCSADVSVVHWRLWYIGFGYLHLSAELVVLQAFDHHVCSSAACEQARRWSDAGATWAAAVLGGQHSEGVKD